MSRRLSRQFEGWRLRVGARRCSGPGEAGNFGDSDDRDAAVADLHARGVGLIGAGVVGAAATRTGTGLGATTAAAETATTARAVANEGTAAAAAESTGSAAIAAIVGPGATGPLFAATTKCGARPFGAGAGISRPR